MDEPTYKRLIAKAFGKAQKITNRGTYECLYPNCREVAIKSHSQQRLGALRSIAEEGLVYSVQRNHYQVMKRLPNTTVMVPTGISEASIFIGFCPDHDRLIFEPLEKIPLEPSNKKQPFLLLFRSFCYEYATKRKVRDWTRTLYKEVETFASADFLEYLDTTKTARDIFLSRDGVYYFERLFDILNTEDFDQIQIEWKIVDKNLGVSCSCVLSPLLDTHESYMAEHWNEAQPLLSFSIVPSSDFTHIVAVWLSTADPFCQWARREMSDDIALESFINRCAFEESEDTCVRPSLWESLSNEEREAAELAIFPAYMRGAVVRPVNVVKI